MNRQEIYADNSGVTIHAIEFHREVEGIPLIIIPGATNSAEEIETDLRGVLPLHHIIINLRGRGKSDSPEKGYSLADQASDILAILNHLNLQECIIFGHSLGSTIGIKAASQVIDRVKGFIMGDFPPFYPPYDGSWAEHVLEREGLQITSTAVHGMAADPTYTDLSEELKGLTCPLLLIRGGKEDSLFPADQAEFLKTIVPNIEVSVLPESGHDIFGPEPGALTQELIRFVTRVS
ncbi:MAG: alpha/beta fold hydrolase [Candidatus Kapaibacterium sp.]